MAVTEDILGVKPVIRGRGWITGVSDVMVEADDPLPTGFTVSDRAFTIAEKLIKFWQKKLVFYSY